MQFTELFQIAEEFGSNNTGQFEVCIDFCTNNAELKTFRCTDKEYGDQFDKTYALIKTAFPNAEVIGNKYGPPKPGGFDIYVEGVGPKEKRDKIGRFYVFQKNRGGEMPPVRAALDNLYILMYSYGDSNELAKYQDIFRRTSLSKSRSAA